MATATNDDPALRLPEILTPRFVGRDRALETLARALAKPPAVVLVEGEAGIGKSRLLREYLASQTPTLQRVLVAVCPPFRESLTLGPIVDAVRHACRAVTGLPLSPLAGALRPLFPEWAADLPRAPESLEDPTAARHRLFCALAELLDCLGADVLVVEDVHWADEVSLDFLIFLTTRPQPPTISVVVTYRPEEVPAGSQLLRLSSRPTAGATHGRIELRPLDIASTAELVSSMLDDDPVSDAFATFLHERTDGVPLAVEESIRLLCDRADLARKDGEWVRRSLDELRVPPTIRDAVLERMHRLDPTTQRLLHAAAVLDEPYPETVIAAVADLPGNRTADGLADALASGLLAEVDQRRRFAFRHALMGRAVYEAIPSPERRHLHLAAGHALEAVAPLPVVQLSRHFREGNETSKWSQYTEQAADLAVASGDHVTAISLLNEIVTIAQPPVAGRVRLARKLAETALARRTGGAELDRVVVDTLHHVLRSPGLSHRDEADIRNRLGRVLMGLREFDAAAEELERAVSEVDGSTVEAARAMIYLGLPFMGSGPASAHRRWLRRAASVDVRALSRADRLSLKADMATALLYLGEEEGWAIAAALPTDASSVEERHHVARALRNVCPIAIAWGRYAEARKHLDAASMLADADGLDRIRSAVAVSHACLDWSMGAWDGLAERVARQLEVDALTPGDYLTLVSLTAQLSAARGLRSKAGEQFRAAVEEGQRAGPLADAHDAIGGLARLRLADGDVDTALRLTDAPLRTITIKQTWPWANELAPVRVDALMAAGRNGDALQVVRALGRWLRGRNAPAPRAVLAACRAIMAAGEDDPVRAAGAFARTAKAWSCVPRPYDALRARERQARCLLAADQTEPGVALLSQVYRDLVELGAGSDADRVVRVLRDHGVELRRPWRGGPKGYGDQLSPRELEVVRLVAAGQTGRQIAHELSKSPRTVDAQVRSAMRKLRVSSRASLAVAAVQAGLVVGDQSWPPD